MTTEMKKPVKTHDNSKHLAAYYEKGYNIVPLTGAAFNPEKVNVPEGVGTHQRMNYFSNKEEWVYNYGKVPLGGKWNERTISKDDKRITQHWGNFGRILGANDLVLDVDPRNFEKDANGNTIDSLQLLRDDLKLNLRETVYTAGGGSHVYLKLDNPEVIKLPMSIKRYKGIDILTKGKQVVICGSYIPPSEAILEVKGVKASDGVKATKGVRAKAAVKEGFYTNGSGEELRCPDALLDMLRQHVTPKAVKEAKETGALPQWHTEMMGGQADIKPTVAKPTVKAVKEQAAATGLITQGVIVKEPPAVANSVKQVEPTTRKYADIPLDGIIHYLKAVNPDCSNKEWIEFGMIVHDWSTSTDGFKAWDDWSSRGSKYSDETTNTAQTWAGFTSGGAGDLTIDSLQYRAIKHHNADRWVDPTGKWTDPYSEWTKSKTKVQKATEARKERKAATKIGACGDFRDKWGVVLHEGKYYELSKMTSVCKDMFNTKAGPFVPTGPKGGVVSATSYINAEGGIMLADRTTYLPAEKGRLVNIGGLSLLNTFCPERMPKAAKAFTKEGQAAIDLFIGNVRFICGTEERFNILMCWMACQVQHMGVKIPWAPFIQSSQGVGKGVIGVVLKAILGGHNVGVVPVRRILSDFTGWQYGSAVNIMNEWTLQGKEKALASEAMKSVISDMDISINKKSIEEYEGINITNYICFTNDKTALVLEENDRRFWVIFSKLDNVVKEIPKLTGMEAEDYYNLMLKPFLEKDEDIIGQFRKHFMEYAIPASFRAINRAPDTPEKTAMLSTQHTEIEGLSEVKELIAKGGKFYNERVVAPREMFKTLGHTYSKVELSIHDKTKILRALNLIKRPGKVKYKKITYDIWWKTPMTNDEIRAEFDSFLEIVPKEIKS